MSEREWWGSKNPKTKHGDSVSGVPCETVVWGDDRRLLVWVDGIEVVDSPMRGWGWGLGQKPETKHS
jgi:hypothetical protein